jgi:phage terminase large subunit-like protein
MLGMPLYPWQRRFLVQLFAEDDHGKWAAPQACLIVPRQNGKSYLMAAVIMAKLFLFNEQLITFTAHRVDTALEVFNLVDQLARSHPATRKRILRTRRAGGKEAIELTNGQRFKIMARARGTGRGFAGDTVIMDEALELRDQNSINALLPTLATRPNSQLIFASSAGDRGSVVLAGVRSRGHAGAPRLLFVEYAADPDAPLDDHDQWTTANPGCPDLISFDAIQQELDSMSADGFRQERLGIWADELSRAVIPAQVWRDTLRTVQTLPEPGRLGLAFDVATDRSASSIMIAWKVADQLIHVRLSRHAAGDNWLTDELAALAQAWQVPVTFDDAGPARDIGEALRLRGVAVEAVGGRDFAASCARLVSGLTGQLITHHPDLALDQAAGNATARNVGEAWAFARRSTSVPISPLTAAALAVWAIDHVKPPRSRFKIY